MISQVDPTSVIDLPLELSDALRDGPFHRALDIAIRHRGLSLEAVQRRMAGHGARVSQATLSYWRRGRRHPGGDRSVLAVQAVERSLGLPPASLTDLINPEHRRGGAPPLPTRQLGVDSALEISPTLMTAFEGIDLDGNRRMSVASIDYGMRVGADRTEALVTQRIAVVSRADGVDRWVTFFDPKAGPGHAPALRATHACRPGRVRRDPVSGVLAMELHFDRPLRIGDTHVFGFDIGYAGARPVATMAQFGVRAPARQLILETRFGGGAVPVRCYQYQRLRHGGSARTQESELSLGPGGTCHRLLFDCLPGVYGIRWEWE